jgi:RHS repeat-associated protein
MAEQRQYTYHTPYKFNGKESDEETGLYYYGARYYDPKLSMWYGVDAWTESYPSWSPYIYTMNNPVKFIDPTGNGSSDTDGIIVNNNGVVVGDDGQNDQKVFLLNTNSNDKFSEEESLKMTNSLNNSCESEICVENAELTQLPISQTDLLNRANWVYGEGGGFFPEYYAHAIQNLREFGVSGRKPFSSDEEMFRKKMTHKNSKGKIVDLYPGYFDGSGGNPNSKAFASLRSNLNKLTSNSTMASSISAVIKSITGGTTDPTNGAYQWVGGIGLNGGIAKNPILNNATNVTNLNSTSFGVTRYHTFYSYIRP